MGKNLLGDTDYASGHDNRYRNSVLIGFVSKIECTDKRASVRVIMPDRVDHEGTPLNTKPIPVLQTASTAKKSFAVPRLNDCVALMKMPNSTSDYFVLGSFYTPKNPPPVKDPMLDYTVYDDGSIMQFDASKGELTWKLKGDLLWDNEKSVTFKLKADFTVQNDGNILLKPTGTATIDAHGAVSIKSPTSITIDAATINLKGNIVHTGSMSTTGAHTDVNGHHSSGVLREELEVPRGHPQRLRQVRRRHLQQLRRRRL
jgi:phage baseplate assembly protein gpV